MRKKTTWMILIVCLAAFLLPTLSFAKSAEDELKQLNTNITDAIAFVEKNDLKNAEARFTEFRTKWFDIEDGIKGKSIDAYRDIEATMGEIQFAFLKDPQDIATITTSLQKLNQQNNRFIQGDLSSFKPALVSSNADKPTVASLITLLEQAIADIQANETQAAKDKVKQFRESWLDVEGVILTQSSKVYTAAESDMVISYSQLSESPANRVGAEETLTKMRNYLIPLSTKTKYTMLDAVTIILREGLEALLVIVALLGFLKKSGNQSKEKWIWSGVGFGVIVSIVLGAAVQILFSSGTFGNNNFLIAGYTGLFAAVMLIYMSYWLHSKSSLTQWNQYISNKSTKALASGSLWPLAILAFLAVFREGTETVLFYIGMASSIALASLLAGIGIGIGILAVLSYLILKIGVKIPMRPFFLISSIFVFYLCFKFLGMGIHGLQLAGVLQATRVSSMSTIEFIALYATWENVIPQAVLLISAIVIVIWSKRKDFKLREQLKLQSNAK
ncbi:MAG: FTR1 family protein [Paenibacillaceae bacterium]